MPQKSIHIKTRAIYYSRRMLIALQRNSSLRTRTQQRAALPYIWSAIPLGSIQWHFGNPTIPLREAGAQTSPHNQRRCVRGAVIVIV